MASSLLARSSRVLKRFSFVSTTPYTLNFTCSRLWSSDSNWKRKSLFLVRRPIYCSAFVRNVASSDVQEEIADVCVPGDGSVIKIKSEANRESSKENDKLLGRNIMDGGHDYMRSLIDECKTQGVSGTYMVEENTHSVHLIDGVDIQGAATPLTDKTYACVNVVESIDGSDVQDVANTATLPVDESNTHIGVAELNVGSDLPDVANTHVVDRDVVANPISVEHDTCDEGITIADNASDGPDVGTCVDSIPTHVAMHVAHMLGIIEYENLAVLQGAANCTEAELFRNLSFLMSVGFTEKQLVDTISKHPSLMVLDLNKSLRRVMRCLEKLGMDASYLKQVLLVEPGLVPLLAKRTLQERVKALWELEFSEQDIASVLKQLGSNQLERFLNLPVEKIEPVFAYITEDIGLKTGDATKLISIFPSVLLRDAQEEYESKMKILTQVVELKKAKKLFVHLPELLARKTEMLEETVMCLKDTVEDVKKLGELIEAYPGLLTHRKSGIQQVCKYLQSLGFDGKAAVALIGREPYLVECGSDRLQKHVEFLKTKMIDDNTVRGLLENSTGMFFKSLQKRVVPKIEFLEKQGIKGESLQKYVKSKPQVCEKSLRKSMNPNLDFLLQLGFEGNSSALKSALKVTLPHSLKSMQARIDYLISLGIEADDVHKMVRDEPSVLVISDSSVKKQVDFLAKVIRRPMQDLVKCPSFLVSSISKTLMPRLRVFEWLSSKGLLKNFSLSTLVETDEAIFVKKFVAAHPEVLPLYKGSLPQL